MKAMIYPDEILFGLYLHMELNTKIRFLSGFTLNHHEHVSNLPNRITVIHKRVSFWMCHLVLMRITKREDHIRKEIKTSDTLDINIS